ncbi:hypothetical protein U1Q18_014954, partial [Sarracenia purpurea var. burkii]
MAILAHPILSFPNSPFKSNKFTILPLHRRRQRRTVSGGSDSDSPFKSSSSMEAAPEGYRKNVGICLINPSKKVFAASRLDIPDAWQMPQ